MSQAKAQALVETILDDPDAFELPSTEAKTRDAFLNLARSIETLQNEVQATKVANQPVKKSPEQLEALAEKIRRTAQSGIKKLMTVCISPFCTFDASLTRCSVASLSGSLAARLTVPSGPTTASALIQANIVHYFVSSCVY